MDKNTHFARSQAESETVSHPTLPKVALVTECPGETIGRYKLLQQIGEGGFGVVYMAQQVEPVKRRVALKIIKLGMDTKQVVARFESERQALALMDHPNIARVLDGGATETGRPYFVMELVHGIKITDYCDQHQLPTRGRLELFIQICRAIQHAHQKGVIHRDIKPSNILVTLHDGVPVPKIIDFGIAKATEAELTEQTVFTQLGQFIGTPAYMSPEQAETSGLDVDTRSDIYSLGVLLYELLTGKTPFDAKQLLAAGLEAIRRTIRETEPLRPSTKLSTMLEGELTTAAKHRQTDPPRLIHLIRGDLDWIVMKCLEKDRTRRYETANGLAMDIQRHLQLQPVVARPPSKVYQFQKLMRRNKVLFGAASAVSTALIVALCVATWSLYKESKARTESESARKNEITQRDIARAQLRRADEKASELTLALAASDYLRADYLISHDEAPEAMAYLCRSLSLNQTNAAVLSRLAMLVAYRTWIIPVASLEDAGEILLATFSDEDSVVTASDDGTIRYWDARTGLSRRASMNFGDRPEALSPNGRRLVTVSTNNTVRVWDSETGQLLMKPVVLATGISSIEFSPDGRQILIALWDDTVRSWDIQAGGPLGEPLKIPGHLSFAEFRGDRTRFLTASSDRIVRVWDARTFQLLSQLAHSASVFSAHFSPDGSRIVTLSLGPGFVWNAETGQVIDGPLKNAGHLTDAKFSPDGTQIVTAGRDGSVRVWDAAKDSPVTEPLVNRPVRSVRWSPVGTRFITLFGHVARIWEIHWKKSSTPLTFRAADPNQYVLSALFSPNGRTILTASADGTARVWDAQTGQALTDALRHAGPVRDAQFSADGRRIVTASQDATARVWDAQTGEAVIAPLKHGGPVVAAQFSPEANRALTASEDGTARVWHAVTGRLISTSLEHCLGLNSARFSPDCRRYLTSTSDETVRVWDAETGKPLTEPLRLAGRIASFSPDGKRILTASRDGTAHVLDARTGLPVLAPLAHTHWLEAAEYSQDGRRIVTAAQDNTARIWDALTGEALAGPLKHDGMVQSARFGADDKRVFTASYAAARVWDAETGQPLTEPLRHPSRILSIRPDPNGTRIVTASRDGAVRVWYLAPSSVRYPEWVAHLAESFCGLILESRGVLHESKLDTPAVLRNIRTKLGKEETRDDWIHWGRWILDESPNCTISPCCSVSTTEWVERKIQENTLESLSEAETLAQDSPALSGRIAKAKRLLENVTQLRWRADSEARSGRWTEAVAAYTELLELEPANHLNYHLLAPLLVQSGNLEGYRHHCEKALARFGETKEPIIAERMAKDCLILPATGMKVETADRLSDMAVAVGASHAYLAYFEFAKGLAEYRQARFGSAVEWTHKVLSRPRADACLDVEACAVLAMAQYRLNQVSQAREALIKGTETADTKLPRLGKGDLGPDWNDWIIAHALLVEARTLIEAQPPSMSEVRHQDDRTKSAETEVIEHRPIHADKSD